MLKSLPDSRTCCKQRITAIDEHVRQKSGGAPADRPQAQFENANQDLTPRSSFMGTARRSIGFSFYKMSRTFIFWGVGV